MNTALKNIQKGTQSVEKQKFIETWLKGFSYSEQHSDGSTEEFLDGSCDSSSSVLDRKQSVPSYFRNESKLFKNVQVAKVLSNIEHGQSKNSNLLKTNTTLNTFVGPEKNYKRISNLEDLLNSENETSYTANELCNSKNIKYFEDFTKVLKYSSQFIESDSSENKSNTNSEVCLVESDSITNISDIIIEDSITQIVSEPSYKTEDLIDSMSSSQNNIICDQVPFLQFTSTKCRKKKVLKKGSLLYVLCTTMAKEKSRINLFRHQLHYKISNVTDKPFILVEIVQHLPTFNCAQLFKCALIEDSKNLLQNLLKDENNQFINIINIPEFSCRLSITEKLILKVYQPWILLDSIQLCMIISRFIVLPNIYLKEFNRFNENREKPKYKVACKFQCTCPSEIRLSNKCECNFNDMLPSIIKIVINNS